MWVLDIISACDEQQPQDQKNKSFYLIAGEWSIGRKRCHFNFNSDASISRSHALLHVGALSVEQLQDPASRPFLKVVDQNSRFGTFVNQDQVFGEKHLQSSDELTFGAKRTVLRVRYQMFLLVASRILKANRSRVNDACQRLGMHLIQTESKDATHCIMDPGKIVATIKVLWALVYNQQVVCTPWLFEILQRKCLADALPKCDQFLPQDEHLPSVANNYLPNPLRKSLFRQYVVVFLVPGSMEELMGAMGGQEIRGYKIPNDQELLVVIEQAASSSRHVMIVEPMISNNSNTNSQSHGGTGSKGGSSSSSSGLTENSCDRPTVHRRVQLLRDLQAPFVTIQELAASVIFVKTPALKSTICFGHHLSGSCNSSFGSSSALTEQKTSCALVEETISDQPLERRSELTHNQPLDQKEHISKKDISPTASSVQNSVEPVRDHHEMKFIKQEPTQESSRVRQKDHSEQQRSAMNLDAQDMNQREQDRVKPEPTVTTNMTTPSEFGAVVTTRGDEAGWVSTTRRFKSLPQIPQELGEPTPIVMSASLVKRKTTTTGTTDPSTPVNTNTLGQLINYKKFKKGNLPASRNNSWSLFPIQTVALSVDNDVRSSMQCSMQAVEEQERIADELFAIAERRAARRKL